MAIPKQMSNNSNAIDRRCVSNATIPLHISQHGMKTTVNQQSFRELQQSFGFDGLQFSEGNGGLIRGKIDIDQAQGEFYLQGGHVTGFQPKGHNPILWMSQESYFESGKPIRGGIPICFPWFGPHPTNPSEPGHGRARLAPWTVQATARTDKNEVLVQLGLSLDSFDLVYRIVFGSSLKLELTTRLNPSEKKPVRFEEALHTYLTIGDIRKISITGLESSAYIDKVASLSRRDATQEAIRFESETDRIYQNTTSTCWLHDPVLSRTIAVRKGGSQSTVVWNPWIAKSARMPDFGDHEWPSMVCVESANVGDHSVELRPGESHSLQVEISVL